MSLTSDVTVVIADDEPLARRRLIRLLADDGHARVVAECSGGREAVEAIATHRPDIVFLDVQMPDLTGFEVVEAVGADAMPTTVFVTAYDQYAMRAFDVHAVDYLLKPYEESRFHLALGRARERHLARAGAGAVEADRLRAAVREALLGAMRGDLQPSAPPAQLAVRVNGVQRVLPIAEIDWIEAEGNYVRIHLGKESHLLRQPISRLERELDPRRFMRVHRSFIVNVTRVTEVQPWFGGDAVLLLRDGTRVRLSRTYREQFQARLLRDDSHPAGAAKR
jgi:two-component system LytT family response regulator